jgi:hypothetical protein
MDAADCSFINGEPSITCMNRGSKGGGWNGKVNPDSIGVAYIRTSQQKHVELTTTARPHLVHMVVLTGADREHHSHGAAAVGRPHSLRCSTSHFNRSVISVKVVAVGVGRALVVCRPSTEWRQTCVRRGRAKGKTIRFGEVRDCDDETIQPC